MCRSAERKPITSAVAILRLFLLSASLTVCAGPVAGAEKPFAVYVMKLDGSQVRKVAQVEGYTIHEAARWSHDGKRVVFSAVNANSRRRRLLVVNMDGSGLRNLGAVRTRIGRPTTSKLRSTDPGWKARRCTCKTSTEMGVNAWRKAIAHGGHQMAARWHLPTGTCSM